MSRCKYGSTLANAGEVFKPRHYHRRTPGVHKMAIRITSKTPGSQGIRTHNTRTIRRYYHRLFDFASTEIRDTMEQQQTV